MDEIEEMKMQIDFHRTEARRLNNQLRLKMGLDTPRDYKNRERMREYMRERRNDPEYQKRLKELRNTPSYKRRQSEYMRDYRRRQKELEEKNNG